MIISCGLVKLLLQWKLWYPTCTVHTPLCLLIIITACTQLSIYVPDLPLLLRLFLLGPIDYIYKIRQNDATHNMNTQVLAQRYDRRMWNCTNTPGRRVFLRVSSPSSGTYWFLGLPTCNCMIFSYLIHGIFNMDRPPESDTQVYLYFIVIIVWQPEPGVTSDKVWSTALRGVRNCPLSDKLATVSWYK